MIAAVMWHRISTPLLYAVLLITAVANLATIVAPPQRLTAYFRTHQYTFPNSDYDQSPQYETDTPATAVRLIGINIAAILVTLVLFQTRATAIARPSPVPFGMPRPRKTPGIGRALYAVWFIFQAFSAVVIAWYLSSLAPSVGATGLTVLAIAALAVSNFLIFSARIRNIGLPQWSIVFGFIPIVGLVVLGFCLLAPTGYASQENSSAKTWLLHLSFGLLVLTGSMLMLDFVKYRPQPDPPFDPVAFLAEHPSK